MKKCIFVFVFCACFQNVNGQEQKIPIIGYGQMKWGTTVDIFLSEHQDAKDITFGYTGYNRIPDFKVFRQEYIGNNTGRNITYLFYQNKLYKVIEYYWGVENKDKDIFFNAILDEMITIYGTVDNSSVRRESEGNAYWDHFVHEIHYNPELLVIIEKDEIYRRQDNAKLGNEISKTLVNSSVDLEVELKRR
jgi:hypothetical protein